MTPRGIRRNEATSAVTRARSLAFRVLRDVARRRGEPAARLEALADDSLSRSDRDLATEIVYGVLRFQECLDFVLAAHSKRPIAELSPTVLLALRIGLYQIRHLSRVPERAAVDESVRLTRAFGAHRGAPYVNAVLREALRRPEVPELPSRRDDPLGYLAITLSHPRWLARRYLERLGLERAEARCRVQNEPPETFCRVSARMPLDEAVATLATEGVVAERFHLVPRCLRVVSGRLRESSLLASGSIFIQEAGAQLVPFLVDPRPGESVLDLCAAPGGKALAIAERVAAEGRVVALDRRVSRARLLGRLGARAGASRLFPVAADGRAVPLRGSFAKILLDAPCTSLGTLRRNPDIKWRVRESDLDAMAALQLELLHRAGEALASGGRLVYATCSTEPEENEEVVARFLDERRGAFRSLPAEPALPQPARSLVDHSGALRTSPERDGLDGYFACVLTRL